MSDPLRIHDDGREADRALLRAAPPAPPPGLQDQLRRSIEQQAGRSRRRRWWGLGVFGVLATGSAFALGTAPGRQLLNRWLATQTLAPRPADFQAHGPTWQPLPSASVPAANPAPTPAPRAARPAASQPPAPTAPKTILHPDLRQPPGASGEWAMTDTPAPGSRPPPPAPLRITFQGRTSELRATANSIEGHLRGAAVSLRLDGAHLTGKIGDQPINLFLRQDQGGGSIAGEATGFALAPTDEGAIVRGWVPGHSVRVELSKAGLSFYPGCERALFPQSAGPGIYKGECAGGQMMQVTLPPGFTAMPLFPRLLVLGVLLTERDPMLKYHKPGLFPDRL